jgi:hypothetical protein
MTASNRSRVLGLVLVLGAVLACIVFVVVLERQQAPGSPPPASIPEPKSPASAASAPVEASAVEQASTTERAPAVAPPPAVQLGDVTVLHVQVVNTAGAAITQGHLECGWQGEWRASNPDTGRVDAELAGSVTDIVLPLIAESCKLTASAAGYPPASTRVFGFRRPKQDAAPLPGRVDHDVRIVLGAPTEGPTLSGSITVNGERRVPEGLAIVVNSTIGLALVDHVAATYVVPKPSVTPTKVVATSDESLSCELAVPPAGADGNWHLDLPLVSGRCLYVHAVDGTNGAAAAGAALTLQVSILSERTVKMMSFRQQTLTSTTDARGNCVFRCLPVEGRATLRESKKEHSEDKPLLELRLTPDSPPEFRETVTLNAAQASVSGTLPVPPGTGPGLSSSYRVQRARIGDGGRTAPVEGAVPVDARSGWSFECEVPSDWRVWLSNGTARVSQIEEVHVTQAPIELRLQEAIELRLRLVNSPGAGSVSIAIVEDAGDPWRHEEVPITASEFVHPLRLHGPARLTVRCKAGKGMSVSESRQILSVDPSRTPELTVDLHGDRVHGVTLTLNGEAPQGETVLPFVGLDASGKPTMEGVIFHLLDGKSRDPVPVVPGTYLYILQSDSAHGAIFGALHVPDSAEPAVLRLDWRGVALPRSSLGTGIEFESIEDVSGSSWVEGLRQVRWSKSWGPEIETLLVPEHAKYRVLN